MGNGARLIEGDNWHSMAVIVFGSVEFVGVSGFLYICKESNG